MLTAVVCLAVACGKPADQEAYENVVSTMSMERSQQFFAKYPQSSYRDRLAEQLVTWCAREATPECCVWLRDTLPRDWGGYREAAAQCDAQVRRDGN